MLGLIGKNELRDDQHQSCPMEQLRNRAVAFGGTFELHDSFPHSIGSRMPMVHSTQRMIEVVLAALLLCACQTKSVRPPSAPSTTPNVDTTGATRYQVDAAASDVHILAYRAGAMARLGHNHVISSKDVGGTLFLQEDLKRSHVALTLPVASLVVDDAKSRSTEGEDFSAEVPQDARDGTRRNLLRPEVLDGDRFAKIALQSVAVAGTRARPELTM